MKEVAVDIATAPPRHNFPFEYVNDLSELNRKRIVKVEETRKDVRDTFAKYEKKLGRQKDWANVNESIRSLVNVCAIPLVATAVIFPISVTITVPLALGGLAVTSCCDLAEERNKSKQTRYASIVARSHATLSHLDHVVDNVLTDGIVTQAEYEIVLKSYTDFKKNIL